MRPTRPSFRAFVPRLRNLFPPAASWLPFAGTLALANCGSSGSSNGDGSTPGPQLPDDVACILGELGCDCRAGDDCDPGLLCEAGTCETDPDATPPDPTETATGNGDSATGTGPGETDGEDPGDDDDATGDDDDATGGDPTSTGG